MAEDATPMSAQAFVPDTHELGALTHAVHECRGCPLFAPATQAVFGEGPADAELILVGEQPGDQEDRQGRPFVGPAGAVLDRALAAAGIARDRVYVTNAVKHFKFEPRGRRRLHQKPRWSEVRACSPWLEAELDALAPKVVVALGATAGQSLVGPGFRLGDMRGRPVPTVRGAVLVCTYHPSAVLRSEPRGGGGEEIYGLLVDDLRLARRLLRTRR